MPRRLAASRSIRLDAPVPRNTIDRKFAALDRKSVVHPRVAIENDERVRYPLAELGPRWIAFMDYQRGWPAQFVEHATTSGSSSRRKQLARPWCFVRVPEERRSSERAVFSIMNEDVAL